ncbi:YceI family protein [Mangrovimonas aestuarii]|uniref:YceI family protein n=1 Tax=Mangrovimonas aestuarii TaxID=3018443 RepID=UPI002378C548|nr:YceI family protein [Mangrovimonas aestuarii]
MKRTLLNMFVVMALAFGTSSCKEKAKEADTTEAQPAAVAESLTNNYTADADNSIIEWKGSKPTGTHNGTINIETGTLQVKDGEILSGTFLIDMNSITVLDLEGEYKNNLESHLKGTVEGKEDHFFNVAKFPTGTFEITETKPMDGGLLLLSGNLSLKDSKHNISFPVTVTTEGDYITIKSEEFAIDRTKWGVNYGSKTIFEDLGDKFVNDDIVLAVNIKAKKQA